MAGCQPTRDEYLAAAREMADTGRLTLARLLAEEAAARTTDPQEAARILHAFPGPNRQED